MTEMRSQQTRKFGRGGARSGGGRPAGSRNLVPKRGTIPDEDLIAELRRKLGEALKRIEVLQNELGYGKPLPSSWDSKRILEAQMRGKIFASPQQLYAAAKLLPIEHPPAVIPSAILVSDSDADREFGTHPEYIEVMRAISTALQPYPEAREAVAEALRSLEIKRRGGRLIEGKAAAT